MRTTVQISIFSSAVACAKQYTQDTIISFLPESPQLESDWRAILASVRRERAAAQEARG